MTSPIAVVGLVYDGHDLQVWPDLMIDELVTGGPGELAEVRGDDWTVPSLEGRQEGVWVYDYRPITLRGQISGSGSTEAARRSAAWTNRLTFASWFDPRVSAELQATLPNGQVWTIDARPIPPILWTEADPTLFKPVTVELASLSPNWTLAP